MRSMSIEPPAPLDCRHTRSFESAMLSSAVLIGRTRMHLGCGVSMAVKSGTPSPSTSEEHTSELQSRRDLVCRLLLEKKKKKTSNNRGAIREHEQRTLVT